MIKLKNVVRPKRIVLTLGDVKVGDHIDSHKWADGPYIVFAKGTDNGVWGQGPASKYVTLYPSSDSRRPSNFRSLSTEVFLV
jgi:hypothetical protein